MRLTGCSGRRYRAAAEPERYTALPVGLESPRLGEDQRLALAGNDRNGPQ